MGGNSEFFVWFVFCGVFCSCHLFFFFVCLFFFGTGTLALLRKQKWGYIHACSASYGAKDRNIVRKTVLVFPTWHVSSFGFLYSFRTTAGALFIKIYTVVSKMFSVQPFPKLSCQLQLRCSWIWCLYMYFKYQPVHLQSCWLLADS